MPVAIIGSVATGASALISSSASKSAADAQTAAADKAQKTQLDMYNQTRQDLQPYNETGKAALSNLADLYGLPTPTNPNGGQPFNDSALTAFRNSPDYQVAFKEGLRGVDQSAAARGAGRS